MISGKFDRWVEAYGLAWETKDPEAAAELFVEDATYQETPFDEPMRGRAEITEYWSSATGSQDEILAASSGEGIAHWGANFVRLATGTPVKTDGVLLAKLDADGRCTEFREWWHSR